MVLARACKIIQFLRFDIRHYLNWKAHLKAIGSKISKVKELLRKLKYIFPKYILCSIHKTLILPHMNYLLLTWGNKCSKNELLQKKAVRPINFKTPIAHTEPLFKQIKQVKLSD